MIFIIVLTILFLDQLSKIIISKILTLHQSVPVIKGVFNLTLVHNRGAAFGILKDQVPFFIFTSILAALIIYIALKSKTSNRYYKLALGLILAGALGNMIDRIAFGYVIDFLDLRVWPVFNLADSSITIGAIMLGWFILFNKKAHQAIR